MLPLKTTTTCNNLYAQSLETWYALAAQCALQQLDDHFYFSTGQMTAGV